MQETLKKNTVTIIIVIATLILAAIAIFTAIKLYQGRQSAVAPNVPESRPAAAEPVACQALAFTISTPTSSPTASPTGTASPTASPTATPTASPVPQCGTSCSTNTDCPSSMVCYVGACRNPSCTTSSSCVCATATASPTPAPAGPTASPIAAVVTSPAPTLPPAGATTPTIIGIAGGIILLILGAATLIF